MQPGNQDSHSNRTKKQYAFSLPNECSKELSFAYVKIFKNRPTFWGICPLSKNDNKHDLSFLGEGTTTAW